YLPDIGLPPSPRVAASATAPATPLTRVERHCLIALVIIILFTVPFWAAFEQTGTSMNFFAAERTRRVAFGYTFPGAWFQSVNSAILLASAPIFAWMWT